MPTPTPEQDAVCPLPQTRQSAAAPAQAGPRKLPRSLRNILCLDDFKEAARRRLPRPVFGFVSGGSEDEITLRENREAFREIGLVTRILRNVSARSINTTLLGETYKAPFGIAPMGISALSTYRGDVALARAARDAGIPMIMSGTSLVRLEDVIQENPDAWFQAYVPGEADRILALLERVRQAGYRTLVLTVDTTIGASRENHTRAGFSTPLRPGLRLAWDGICRPRWLFGTFLRSLLHGMPHFENSAAIRGAPILSSTAMRDFGAKDHLDWSHLELVRKHWKGRLVVKGILHRDDARMARDAGADGIIVSNHGGRQLDGSVSPLRVLPGIVEEIAATGARIPIMIDGGIRRGTDVLKALALGADFVFVGRPFNYASAVAGQDGVRHAIALLSEEVRRGLGMLGLHKVGELPGIELESLVPRGISGKLP